MKSNWQSEVRKVRRFRKWAKSRIYLAQREGNYLRWDAIYTSVDEFLETDTSLWSPEDTEDLLYILALDWKSEAIAHKLQTQFPHTVAYLSEKSLQQSDFDARWQLANILGYLPSDTRAEPLLRRFLNDEEEEYVRRRALQALTRLGASGVEQIALQTWDIEQEDQESARSMALWVWQQTNSPLLEPHLTEAEACAEKFPYLADLARRIRKGEGDSF